MDKEELKKYQGIDFRENINYCFFEPTTTALTQPKFEPDSIVKSIINKFEKRAEKGFKKYNQTLDRDDLEVLEWIEHAQDELMDGILYLEKLKQTLSESKKIF